MEHRQTFSKDDLEKLVEGFSALPRDTILDVVISCNYDVLGTITILKELTSSKVNGDGTQNVSFGGTRRKTGGLVKLVERSNFIQTIELINEGWKVLVLMRGLPGSGKTTRARDILKNTVQGLNSSLFIFSADDYFRKGGQYSYDVKKLELAHLHCQQRCYNAMGRGLSPIIIDNTNLQKWEMRVYFAMGVQFGYCIEIAEPETAWARDPEGLARRNTHKVSKTKIIQMMNRFDTELTSRLLMREFNLQYQCQMPQGRMFPPLEPPLKSQPKVEADEEEAQLKLVMQLSLQEAQERARAQVPIIKNNFNFEEEGLYETKLPPIKEYVHKPAAKSSNTNSAMADSTTDTTNIFSTEHRGTEYVHQFKNKPLETSVENSVEEKNETEEVKKPEVKEDDNVSLIDLNEDMTVGAAGHFPLMPVPTYNNTFGKSDSDIQNKKMKSNDYDDANNAKQGNFNTKSYNTMKFSDLSFDALDSWITTAATENVATQANNDVLSSWGTSIAQLKSWNTTIPVKSSSEPAITITRRPEIVTQSVQLSDKQTNTTVEDFKFALNCPESESDIVLMGRNRPINTGNVAVKLSLRSRITVDVGCMTEDDLLMELDDHNADHVAKLREFFPHIPMVYMLEVYEKCQKDINWTMELLAETDYIPPPPQPKQEAKQSKPVEQSFTQQKSTETPNQLNSWEMLDPLHEMVQKLKKEDEMMNLKRQLEENVSFKREHYSDHTWEIKNIKQGITPQTSQCVEDEAKNNESSSESEENSDDTYDEDTNKVFQLDLGTQLVSQLEKMFGNKEKVDQRLNTVVQMPESLARQLHALYLQSICLQIDNKSTLVSEDEELAKQMQEEEHNSKEPNLSRIMDEQLAEFLQQKDMEQYKNISPDDLATKLTKIKLYETFPTLKRSNIDSVLVACNFKYNDAVLVLINSVEKNTIRGKGNLLDPPISESTLQEMKTNKAMTEKSLDDDEATNARNAQSFREEASECLKRRKHLQELVNMYHQKGMGEVAVFYSELARKAQQQLDCANQKASYLHMYENSAKLNDGITLDLHYLYVKEAVTSLDVFIDHQVCQLIKQNKPRGDFYIITGRGNRSSNGKSKIKPAVMTRLRKRNVKFSQINPGLLKIKLHKNLAMDTDI